MIMYDCGNTLRRSCIDGLEMCLKHLQDDVDQKKKTQPKKTKKTKNMTPPRTY